MTCNALFKEMNRQGHYRHVLGFGIEAKKTGRTCDKSVREDVKW
jgi:hypothetical protein